MNSKKEKWGRIFFTIICSVKQAYFSFTLEEMAKNEDEEEKEEEKEESLQPSDKW